MIRIPFNDGWAFGPLVSVHEAIRVAGPGNDIVTLPHDALLRSQRAADNSGGPQTGYFQDGKWTYEKQFDVPAEWVSKRVTFEFEGVYRDAVVYINGALAGQCANGYSAFHVEADAYLNYGESNTIRVDAQAHEDSRWYSGGGIYRPVHLLVGDLVHITPRGLRIATPEVDAELATAVVTTEVVNRATGTRTVEVELEIRDAKGTRVASDQSRLTLLPGERITARQRAFIRQPALWSVDSPDLYQATIKLFDENGHIDDATASFGIRTVTADPVRGLRINGEPIKLRGACIHHDHGILGAAEFSDASDRRVRVLKAAGFNAVRSAHNPMSTAMLEACDRHGVLVMDELFDMWTVPKSGDDFSRRFVGAWEQDVDSLVAKNFNHPSVIMYSIGNEIIEAGTNHGARWGRKIADRVREQDPTRLVTHALQGMYIARDKIPELRAKAKQDSSVIRGLNDYLGQVTELMDELMASPVVGDRLLEPSSPLDVVGLNYGDSRYVLDGEAYPNRVIVGSESFPSRIDHLWKLVSENPYIIGDFTWTGWDFLGEVGTGRHVYPEDAQVHRAPYPWLSAVCGDIDLIGDRKPMSFYRETVFGLTSGIPYLAARAPREDGYVIEPKAWTWADVAASWTWDVASGTQMHVEAYTTGDEVEFKLNGTTVATAAVGANRNFVAEAQVPFEPGTLEAISYRNGVELGRSILHTADEPSRLLLRTDRPSMSTNDQQLAYVDISLVDASGRVNPLRDRTITLELEGPGTLQGFGTADPATEESFLDTAHTAYKGRALAVVRATGEVGPVTLTARANGLKTAELRIVVQHPVDSQQLGAFTS
ncbi:beta-galactosidase [Arthrobacter sp. StoSoilA2]|uniref:glycoside hydrolase family 2 TIM barrel-domain containing protein n=1 Tax=Arthrobacter sp. StoSoilA2 TaxID=2830990 RepID=UPI001CC4FB8E|nr:glycoside hydrolase family 2 TIM barrel-domain containing protein [Arthrobacter sp. StoSoilA2]BCW36024.1 beta-galactosidase [Arthrobacter sp. StoSoilA2]